jgi:hypothetical protein
MSAPTEPERAYPVPGPINIEAFTRVLFALAAVLVDAGYPLPLDGDMPALAVSLGGFMHGIAS